MQGRFVHRWQRPRFPGLHNKLLPNGNLLTGVKIPTGPLASLSGSGGELVELDWDSKVVWKYEDLYINSHDWHRLENGNTLIAHWIPVPAEKITKIKGGIQGSELDGTIWDDCLQEITPEGKIEWEWIAHEHLNFETDVMCPVCPRFTWSYINSNSVLPNGDILVSFRQINTIAIIDKSTGKFKWRWGPGKLGHQHAPTLLDNGNILVFDNGTHCQNLEAHIICSKVVEINPRTNEIEWEYTDEKKMWFYSPVCGNAQRLPNGNTLICEAAKGRIFEVTPEKEKVWEFFNPFYISYSSFGYANITYQAYRYGPDYKGFRGKDLDPDRFEWVLQEKGKPEVAKASRASDKIKVMRSRLTGLGY
jgi:hypothetical protein